MQPPTYCKACGQRLSVITLADKVAAHLGERGRATTMEIAVALSKHASNISTILRLDNRFIKVHKEGRAVYYGLAFMEAN
jgi:hypothetical protein